LLLLLPCCKDSIDSNARSDVHLIVFFLGSLV
jgi:hypothetical protein